MHVCLSVNKTVEMQENRPFAIESVSCRRKPSEASRRRGAAFFCFCRPFGFALFAVFGNGRRPRGSAAVRYGADIVAPNAAENFHFRRGSALPLSVAGPWTSSSSRWTRPTPKHTHTHSPAGTENPVDRSPTTALDRFAVEQ